jgi:hypothetical protein
MKIEFVLILLTFIVNSFKYSIKHVNYAKLLNPLVLSAKSRMPVFDDEEKEQLRKILNNEIIDFSANIPKKKITEPVKPTTTPFVSAVDKTRKITPVTEPNANWRSALSSSSSSSKQARSNRQGSFRTNDQSFKQIEDPDDDLSFTDLSYSDFEQAMFEEEGYGLNPGGGGKRSFAPIESDGLNFGDIIDKEIFSVLKDTEGHF